MELSPRGVIGLTVPFWGGAGLAEQEPQQGGVAEKAGERLDEFGRAIKQGIVNAEETVREGLNKTGETVRESFAKTRESVNTMGLGPRVYGRLHWDKALNSCSLFIKVEGSRVTLVARSPTRPMKPRPCRRPGRPSVSTE